MAKLIITVEGGKFTQTLNFPDRNIKDNRYIYENGNESGIMEDPMELYEDIPECSRITEIKVSPSFWYVVSSFRKRTKNGSGLRWKKQGY